MTTKKTKEMINVTLQLELSATRGDEETLDIYTLAAYLRTQGKKVKTVRVTSAQTLPEGAQLKNGRRKLPGAIAEVNNGRHVVIAATDLTATLEIRERVLTGMNPNDDPAPKLTSSARGSA